MDSGFLEPAREAGFFDPARDGGFADAAREAGLADALDAGFADAREAGLADALLAGLVALLAGFAALLAGFSAALLAGFALLAGLLCRGEDAARKGAAGEKTGGSARTSQRGSIERGRRMRTFFAAGSSAASPLVSGSLRLRPRPDLGFSVSSPSAASAFFARGFAAFFAGAGAGAGGLGCSLMREERRGSGASPSVVAAALRGGILR